jgi:hypothetical protein
MSKTFWLFGCEPPPLYAQTQIPTGEIAPVAGTRECFVSPTLNAQVPGGNGYDHNLMLFGASSPARTRPCSCAADGECQPSAPDCAVCLLTRCRPSLPVTPAVRASGLTTPDVGAIVLRARACGVAQQRWQRGGAARTHRARPHLSVVRVEWSVRPRESSCASEHRIPPLKHYATTRKAQTTTRKAQTTKRSTQTHRQTQLFRRHRSSSQLLVSPASSPPLSLIESSVGS